MDWRAIRAQDSASARQTWPRRWASLRVEGGATTSPSRPPPIPVKFGMETAESEEYPERILIEEKRPPQELRSSEAVNNSEDEKVGHL